VFAAALDRANDQCRSRCSPRFPSGQLRSGHYPFGMAQLTTDAAALAKEASNFERIAAELKNVIARVESTAAGLDNHWRGIAAQAAQQAISRFQQAADAQVAQLNEISTGIHTAAAQYSTTDDERAGALASAMGIASDNSKEHNGVQLVDWKQAPTPTPSPGPTGPDIREAIKGLPKGTAPFIDEIRSEQDLRNLWSWATEGATEPSGSKYPGTERVLPDGTRIGMRESGDHGPTMDIRTPDNSYTKVHVNSARGGVPELPVRGAAAPAEGAAAGPRAPVESAPVEGAPVGPVAPRPTPLSPEPFVPMGPAGSNPFPHFVEPPHSHHGPPIIGRDDPSDPAFESP
jgi:WXG100 family type VII secretion target